MATSTIVALTTASTLASDDYVEIGGNTNGSRKYLATLLGNSPVAFGTTTLNSATANSFAIPFGGTLGAAPTRIKSWLIIPTQTSNLPGVALVAGSITTTQFVIALTGQLGNTTSQLYWEAYP